MVPVVLVALNVSLLALVKSVSAVVKVSTATDPPVRFCVTVAPPNTPAISMLPAEFDRLTEGLAAVNVAVTNGMISPIWFC